MYLFDERSGEIRLQKMPQKLLERQYQLQAQKRHEEFLKQDYYKQTARYFEREATAAKKFSSWITRGSEFYTDRLKKMQRAEKLSYRREKLKKLLSEEDETYRQELEEEKRTQRQINEKLSLEELHQKLLEKKAEQSLYYPTTCRRLQSYTLKSTDTARKLDSLNISNENEYNTHVNKCSHKNNHFSTSPSLERALVHSKYENNTENGNRKQNFESPRPSNASFHTYNKRFAPHNNRRSLEHTNICNDELDNQCHPSLNNQQTNKKEEVEAEDDNTNNVKSKKQYYNENVIQKLQSPSNTETLSDIQTNSLSEHNKSGIRETASHPEDQHRTFDQCFALMHDEDMQNNSTCYKRGHMLQKNPDCGNASMSVQMYRYLKHNDLKCKIFDLCKREHLFVVKKSWEEALRLREMRNELILLKNKNLFENNDLKMNDETRFSGLSIIKARELLNNKRAKICNSFLYSDEAKDLWKMWALEDDEIEKVETNSTRNLLLNELEEEWKNLALRDKNRVTQLYDRVMTNSDLQNEHELAAIIREGNDSQKQYMNYLAT